MHGRKVNPESEKSAEGSASAAIAAPERAAVMPSALASSEMDQVVCRIGDASCAGAHAARLRRAVAGPQGAGSQQAAPQQVTSLLRLQRQYGNRYVGRVLAVAGLTGQEEPVAAEIQEGIDRERGGGQPLGERARASIERALGADFSSVRVHTGAQADRLSESLSARAFAVGPDIFFRNGEYNPDSGAGRELLAHELTHVVQQGGERAQGELTLGQPDDQYEQEADRVARSIGPATSGGGAPAGVQGARRDGDERDEDKRRVRQKRNGSVQRDFAVPPTTPRRHVRTLSAGEIQAAITFNRARHTDAAEIRLLRDILGTSPEPAVIDEDFVLAVARYQAQYGLTQDGRLGEDTADRLAREVVAESQTLRPGPLGRLGAEFGLQTGLETLVNNNDRDYAHYRNAIQAATMVQRHVVLQDHAFLRRMLALLTWNSFARCMELLGRRAPTGGEMRVDAAVRAALTVAWNASNAAITLPAHNPANPPGPCNPPAGGPVPAAHEEGGFIYMNLVTGDLSARAVAAGGQAALQLANAPLVAESIVVGGYHTHPNVGACWGAPFFSGADINWSAANGVPILMRGAFPLVANTTDHATGTRRFHLAGNRGLPGAGGGLAPQAAVDRPGDDL